MDSPLSGERSDQEKQKTRFGSTEDYLFGKIEKNWQKKV
jgi:hypothetical protein